MIAKMSQEATDREEGSCKAKGSTMRQSNNNTVPLAGISSSNKQAYMALHWGSRVVDTASSCKGPMAGHLNKATHLSNKAIQPSNKAIHPSNKAIHLSHKAIHLSNKVTHLNSKVDMGLLHLRHLDIRKEASSCNNITRHEHRVEVHLRE